MSRGFMPPPRFSAPTILYGGPATLRGATIYTIRSGGYVLTKDVSPSPPATILCPILGHYRDITMILRVETRGYSYYVHTRSYDFKAKQHVCEHVL